jgi:hypothetical protein
MAAVVVRGVRGSSGNSADDLVGYYVFVLLVRVHVLGMGNVLSCTRARKAPCLLVVGKLDTDFHSEHSTCVAMIIMITIMIIIIILIMIIVVIVTGRT